MKIEMSVYKKQRQTTVTVALLVSQTGNNTSGIERKMVKQLLVYLHYRIRLSDNKAMSDSYVHQFQKHFVEDSSQAEQSVGADLQKTKIQKLEASTMVFSESKQKIDQEEYKKLFWGNGTVLNTKWDGNYTDAYVHQNFSTGIRKICAFFCKYTNFKKGFDKILDYDLSKVFSFWIF